MSKMDVDPEQGVASESFGTSVMEGGRIKREHLIHILDGIDREVETLRRQAIDMQEKRDQLHTRIDLLRTDFLAQQFDDDFDPDEVSFYLKRVKDRLKTVDVHVKTIRDDSQIESIHHINNLIDEIIRLADPIEQRRKLEAFLNSCAPSVQFNEEIIMTDKKFEYHLLSCTLDDQKLIKKRLEALMRYMMKQMIGSE